MAKKLSRMNNIAEIPDVLSEKFSLEIYSANEAVLMAKSEIEELDDSIVKILSGNRKIIFHGNNIKISCFTPESIKICGNILSVEFL